MENYPLLIGIIHRNRPNLGHWVRGYVGTWVRGYVGTEDIPSEDGSLQSGFNEIQGLEQHGRTRARKRPGQERLEQRRLK